MTPALPRCKVCKRPQMPAGRDVAPAAGGMYCERECAGHDLCLTCPACGRNVGWSSDFADGSIACCRMCNMDWLVAECGPDRGKELIKKLDTRGRGTVRRT